MSYGGVFMAAIAQIQNPKHAGFKHILIATDFSAASERALTCALPIVRRYGSEVSIMHAIRPETITWESSPEEFDRERFGAEKEMARLAEETRVESVHPRLLLEKGRAWDVLSSIMQRENTDLLVMGTHGRRGLKKLALGSVAEEVLRRARCPVLTVGPHVPLIESEATEFKTILFATDFGPASAKAFAYALSLAQDYQAKLILLHMVPPMQVSDMGPVVYCPAFYLAQELTEWQAMTKKESLRKLQELVPPTAGLKSQPECLVGFDFLPEGILDTAEAHKVDLIVMGANPVASAPAVSHAPWALTHDIICGAKCPVLTLLS
jgi:nucleotide-binding universal stress UspA family protein